MLIAWVQLKEAVLVFLVHQVAYGRNFPLKRTLASGSTIHTEHLLEGDEGPITLGISFPFHMNLAVNHRDNSVTELIKTKHHQSDLRTG